MTTECIHHFIIAPPQGPISKAVCLKCGREREYETAYPWKTYNKAALTVKEQNEGG